MKAVVTGASSGLGREFAKYLDSLGYELFLVSRYKEELENTSRELKNKSKIIVMDLSDFHNLKSLYVLLKNEDIDVLINNAGFGIFGEFCSTDITDEVEMINLNITAVHVLTKLFLKDMKKRGIPRFFISFKNNLVKTCTAVIFKFIISTSSVISVEQNSPNIPNPALFIRTSISSFFNRTYKDFKL